MLARVAHQQNPVAVLEMRQEFVHVRGADLTGLVDDIESRS
jgi:hypothetical protein